MTSSRNAMTVTDAVDAPTQVRLQPPSPALMRVVNVFMRRVLASPRLGRRLRRQALLEFDGRRTGRRRRIPVCLHLVDGRAIVLTKREWRLNFVGGAAVTVTSQGRRRSASARLVDATPAQIGAAVRAALDNGATPFDLGLKLPRHHEPTEAELATLPLGLIHIDFAEA